MAQPLQTMFNFILLSSVVTLTGVTGLGEMVIGDIQLVPDSTNEGYYQPLVYYTNGIEPLQLGGICYDNIGKIQATVICNQLGYNFDDYQAASAHDTSYPIWLSDVKCEDQQLQHILSCDYNVTFGYQVMQSPCKTNQHLIVKCDQNNPLTMGMYDGYIMLCPPDNVNLTSRSNSFGLVAIYLSQHDSWRGINQPNNSKTLGVNEANAICQQLGYTMAVPGSAVTSRAVQTNYTFKHCYDTDPPYRVQSEAWMSTDAVKCSGPQTCFGCCYNYPPTPQCEYCEEMNNLVLQCTFVPEQAQLSSGKGGAENECDYNKKSCQSTSKFEVHVNMWAIIGPSIVAVVSIVANCICAPILLCSVVHYCRRRQHNMHNHQGRQNQQNRQNNQEDGQVLIEAPEDNDEDNNVGRREE